MLADFGLTRVVTSAMKMEMPNGDHDTTSFMAPELLLPSKFGLTKEVPSKEADIYALGMTVYQVLTGKCPFFPKRIAEVVHAVISGERPPKPENAEETGMTEVVWGLLEECWREDRTTRPTAVEVLRRFCEITGEVGPIRQDLEARKQDTGKRYIADAESPCDLLKYLIRELHRDKNKYLWERVKRMIACCVSPLLGWV